MRYIQGQAREQATLLPEVLDDYIMTSNPVRFIDAYVNQLDFVKLGFTHSEPKSTGRKPYHPGDLLKLYIYGYLNKLRTSRDLEKATHRNIELIWLMRRLCPDFKTIADFRKDNTNAIKQICREFTLFCKKMDLFGGELIAIDGSKFSASNSNKRNFTKNKLDKIIKKIDTQIDDYLSDLDREDERERDIRTPSAAELKKIIEGLQKKKDKYQKLQSDLKHSDHSQISQTDPDSRMMRTHQGKDVAYNVQIVTDKKHKLIVEHEVSNEGTDDHFLSTMSLRAKETLGVEKLEVVADAGYNSFDEIKKCADAGITTYVPLYNRSRNKKAGLFTIADFSFDSENKCYHCPAGQCLTYCRMARHRGKEVEIYKTSACLSCALKSRCTKAKKGRLIRRWVHHEVIDALKRRVSENPEMMQLRKGLVEHPFGTIKHWMGHDHFLMRGFDNVRAEMSLSVLCYNLKRVLNIVDFKELMAAVA